MNFIQQIGVSIVLVKMPVPGDVGLLNKSSFLGAALVVIKIIIIVCTLISVLSLT
jgi:hypothetical protein